MSDDSSAFAAFDLDGTLIEGDSELLWCRFLFARRVIDAQTLQKFEAFFTDYENGQLNFTDYMEQILAPLKVNPVEGMLILRGRYLESISGAFRPSILERVKWHQDQGHRILLITATHDFLAVPIAALMHIQDLICTQTEWNGQAFTGKTVGIPAFRQGKITRLNSWVKDKSLSLESGWAYSDSHNDLPLLRGVGHPVAVFPDKELLAYAASHGWEVLSG